VATATEPRQIRVLVADDHLPTREGVRLLLERAGMEICAEAADAQTAVEAAAREHPDICLLETLIPGSGIAATAEITRMLPRTPVVMFSSSGADESLFDSLRAGAAGYLLKDMNTESLPRALVAVLEGEAALSRRLVARLINEYRDRGHHRRARLPSGREVDLTSREWEVLDLLRQHLTTAEIASRLFISEGTVRTHVAAVLHKLGVPDRQSALRLLDEQID
jgi:DNA-binding NarL/FixJ family response regulator